MNFQETTQIITLLAGNYNSIAEKDKMQKQLMVTTWHELLGDLDYKIVLQAVKKSMIESPYPPTIHEIRKNSLEIQKPTEQRTAIEAWNEAYKMICNGLYMTEERFKEASPEIQKFFGGVNQIKELAMMDSKTINSVTKGQFLKHYEILVEREKAKKMLPERWNIITKDLVEKMSVPQISEGRN